MNNAIFIDMYKTYCEDYDAINWNTATNEELTSFNKKWIGCVTMSYGIKDYEMQLNEESNKPNEKREFLHGIYYLLYKKHKYMWRMTENFDISNL